MSRSQWITPQTAPQGFVAFVLVVPSGPVYLGAIRAFLHDLSEARNWQSLPGGITSCDAAALGETILLSFEERVECSLD